MSETSQTPYKDAVRGNKESKEENNQATPVAHAVQGAGALPPAPASLYSMDNKEQEEAWTQVRRGRRVRKARERLIETYSHSPEAAKGVTAAARAASQRKLSALKTESKAKQDELKKAKALRRKVRERRRKAERDAKLAALARAAAADDKAMDAAIAENKKYREDTKEDNSAELDGKEADPRLPAMLTDPPAGALHPAAVRTPLTTPVSTEARKRAFADQHQAISGLTRGGLISNLDELETDINELTSAFVHIHVSDDESNKDETVELRGDENDAPYLRTPERKPRGQPTDVRTDRTVANKAKTDLRAARRHFAQESSVANPAERQLLGQFEAEAADGAEGEVATGRNPARPGPVEASGGDGPPLLVPPQPAAAAEAANCGGAAASADGGTSGAAEPGQPSPVAEWLAAFPPPPSSTPPRLAPPAAARSPPADMDGPYCVDGRTAGLLVQKVLDLITDADCREDVALLDVEFFSVLCRAAMDFGWLDETALWAARSAYPGIARSTVRTAIAALHELGFDASAGVFRRLPPRGPPTADTTEGDEMEIAHHHHTSPELASAGALASMAVQVRQLNRSLSPGSSASGSGGSTTSSLQEDGSSSSISSDGSAATAAARASRRRAEAEAARARSMVEAVQRELKASKEVAKVAQGVLQARLSVALRAYHACEADHSAEKQKWQRRINVLRAEQQASRAAIGRLTAQRRSRDAHITQLERVRAGLVGDLESIRAKLRQPHQDPQWLASAAAEVASLQAKIASQQEQLAHARPLPPRQRSDHHGVYFNRRSGPDGKWVARCSWTERGHRQQKHIGSFDSEVDAALAYDDFVLRMWGATAKLNFPDLAPAGKAAGAGAKRRRPEEEPQPAAASGRLQAARQKVPLMAETSGKSASALSAVAANQEGADGDDDRNGSGGGAGGGSGHGPGPGSVPGRSKDKEHSHRCRIKDFVNNKYFHCFVQAPSGVRELCAAYNRQANIMGVPLLRFTDDLRAYYRIHGGIRLIPPQFLRDRELFLKLLQWLHVHNRSINLMRTSDFERRRLARGRKRRGGSAGGGGSAGRGGQGPSGPSGPNNSGQGDAGHGGGSRGSGLGSGGGKRPKTAAGAAPDDEPLYDGEYDSADDSGAEDCDLLDFPGYAPGGDGADLAPGRAGGTVQEDAGEPADVLPGEPPHGDESEPQDLYAVTGAAPMMIVSGEKALRECFHLAEGSDRGLLYKRYGLTELEAAQTYLLRNGPSRDEHDASLRRRPTSFRVDGPVYCARVGCAKTTAGMETFCGCVCQRAFWAKRAVLFNQPPTGDEPRDVHFVEQAIGRGPLFETGGEAMPTIASGSGRRDTIADRFGEAVNARSGLWATPSPTRRSDASDEFSPMPRFDYDGASREAHRLTGTSGSHNADPTIRRGNATIRQDEARLLAMPMRPARPGERLPSELLDIIARGQRFGQQRTSHLIFSKDGKIQISSSRKNEVFFRQIWSGSQVEQFARDVRLTCTEQRQRCETMIAQGYDAAAYRRSLHHWSEVHRLWMEAINVWRAAYLRVEAAGLSLETRRKYSKTHFTIINLILITYHFCLQKHSGKAVLYIAWPRELKECASYVNLGYYELPKRTEDVHKDLHDKVLRALSGVTSGEGGATTFSALRRMLDAAELSPNQKRALARKLGGGRPRAGEDKGKGKAKGGADTRKCYLCGQVGHIRRNCPNKGKKDVETKEAKEN